jgi:hypothetical protein
VHRANFGFVGPVLGATFQWLPSQIDLGFAGTSALITATIALAVGWSYRLIRALRSSSTPDPTKLRFGALATLSSAAAALGAVLGLAFTIVGAVTA